MAAWFVRSPQHRKPHVISNGLASADGTLYTTACGQFVRFGSGSGAQVFEAGQIAPEDVCGICRSKTKQALA